MSSRCLPLALLILGSVPSAAPQARTEVHSRHFAVATRPDGGREVLSTDGRALALGGARPVFGPGELFLLLDAEPIGGQRGARLLGADLRQRAAFQLPAELEPLLGREGIALRRRSLHARGTAFRVEFHDLAGRPTGAHREEGLVLLQVEPLDDGRWAATSVDPQGATHLHVFDGEGTLRWTRDLGAVSAPVVASAPAGGLTALGAAPIDEPGTSRLELVDARGRTVASSRVPAFRLARFDPAGERLALAGRHTLALVRAADGELLFTRDQALPLLLGESVAFSADGRALRALAYRPAPDGAPEALTLLQLADLDGTPRGSARPLDEVALPGRRALELTDEAGVWRLVTRTGTWTLND